MEVTCSSGSADTNSDVQKLMKLRLAKRFTRKAWADLEDPESDSGDELKKITYVTKFSHSEGSDSEPSDALNHSSSSLEQDSSETYEESSSASSSAVRGSSARPLEDLELSLGSRGHATGDCTPCYFAHRSAGCNSGSACKFCHLPHQRKHKVRPCRQRRDRFQIYLENMHKELDENSDAILSDPNWLQHVATSLPAFVQKKTELKLCVIRTLASHAEKVLQSQKTPTGMGNAAPHHPTFQSTDPRNNCDRQSNSMLHDKSRFKTSL